MNATGTLRHGLLNWIWLRAGKSEQWSTLFQVLLTTAHHQLDLLYSGLQDAEEASAYRCGIRGLRLTRTHTDKQTLAASKAVILQPPLCE